MKFHNFLIALCVMFFAISCSEEDEETVTDMPGTVMLMFDNIAGDSDLIFVEDGSTTLYDLINANNQDFNLDLMGYYISEIKLTGMEGTEDYADEINISADEALGFYLVEENAAGIEGNMIMLENVPVGHYTNLTFTLGVSFDYVTEGSQGGDLSQSNGYFWSWNNGYVGYKLEGTAADGGVFNTETGAYDAGTDVSLAYHVGGEGDDFSNIKTISMSLDTHIMISSESSSTVSITADALNALSGHMDVDFMTLPTAHAPSASQHIAHNLSSAFAISSIENNNDEDHSHE